MERYERHHQLQDTIPQHCGESTTGRPSEWVLLQVWKTPFTPPATPLSATPALVLHKWRRHPQGLQKSKRRKAPGPDDTTLIGLIQGGDESAYRPEVKELSGAVLTTWSVTRSKQWRWSWTSGEAPCSPEQHHREQHCDCSGVIQIHGQHHLPGPEVGQSHRLHCEKGPAEVVLLSPAEEVQPATGTAETVLLCHHWIRPLHINNCLVQLSYQIWPKKTTEGSPDCWANHWYKPPHSPRTVFIQSEQKGWKNHSNPSNPAHSLFELLPSGRRNRALSTRTTRHRNSFFPQAIRLMNTWH